MSKSCDLCTIVIDDSKYFDCDICGVKSVHYDCLTVKIDGDPISCGIHCKCKSCASLSVTDMFANVLERLKRLDTLCADVADLKSVVKKTIKPRNFANVSRKTRTGGGPPQLVDDKRSEVPHLNRRVESSDRVLILKICKLAMLLMWTQALSLNYPSFKLLFRERRNLFLALTGLAELLLHPRSFLRGDMYTLVDSTQKLMLNGLEHSAMQIILHYCIFEK